MECLSAKKRSLLGRRFLTVRPESGRRVWSRKDDYGAVFWWRGAAASASAGLAGPDRPGRHCPGRRVPGRGGLVRRAGRRRAKPGDVGHRHRRELPERRRDLPVWVHGLRGRPRLDTADQERNGQRHQHRRHATGADQDDHRPEGPGGAGRGWHHVVGGQPTFGLDKHRQHDDGSGDLDREPPGRRTQCDRPQPDRGLRLRRRLPLRRGDGVGHHCHTTVGDRHSPPGDIDLPGRDRRQRRRDTDLRHQRRHRRRHGERPGRHSALCPHPRRAGDRGAVAGWHHPHADTPLRLRRQLRRHIGERPQRRRTHTGPHRHDPHPHPRGPLVGPAPPHHHRLRPQRPDGLRGAVHSGLPGGDRHRQHTARPRRLPLGRHKQRGRGRDAGR